MAVRLKAAAGTLVMADSSRVTLNKPPERRVNKLDVQVTFYRSGPTGRRG